MNICVIGYNPSSGPYTYGSVSMWAANAWEELGHDVQRFDRKEMDKLPKKADIYFFVDCSEDYSQSMPGDLDGLKVFWNMDMQMPGGTERAVNIARKVDYTFCTNHEYGVRLLEKFGIDSAWVPYGYDRMLMSQVSAQKLLGFKQGDLVVFDANGMLRQDYYKYDVCMIGNPNSPERVQLWELLEKKYGGRAVTRTIDTREEYIAKKGLSRIMISQPTEPHNTIINLRVFNALACGKLLLCKVPGVKEHALLGLKDGVNVVYWQDFDDLTQKIDYYLEHTHEADAIAAAGKLLGLKYLMTNQVRVIEQVLFSKFYDRLAR